ncbi:unnamed protein product [Malus baccata var. baccata]
MQASWTLLEPQFSPRHSLQRWTTVIGKVEAENAVSGHFCAGLEKSKGGFSLLRLNSDNRRCGRNSLHLCGFTSGNNFAKLLLDTYVISE